MAISGGGSGGYLMFGPTYNSTPYVRLGYEGILASKPLSAALVADAQGTQGLHDQATMNDYPLAGLIAALDDNGNLVLASATNTFGVGLFREDLGDMVNASNQGTYYFGYGEYYVAESRISQTYITAGPKIGDLLTWNNTGNITSTTAADAYTATNPKVVGTCTFVGEYPAGNMYANAGLAANGGNFVGFVFQLN